MSLASASASQRKHVVHTGTLQEFFAFNDWANDKVLSQATGLNDDQTDRPFEMGEGSIRKTLNHLFAAECVWLDRWEGARPGFSRVLH